MPVRPKRVHPDIRVASMDEDLLILLIPGIERVPVDSRGAGHPIDRVFSEDPRSSRPVPTPRAQAVASRRALAKMLVVSLVNEEARVDVVDRDVVMRIERPFP